MRSLLSKRRLVVGTAVVLFLFSLNLVSFQVRSFVTSLFSPLQASLWQAGDSISIFFSGGKIRVENETLKQENFDLLHKIIALRDVERENAELRKLLEFGLAEQFHMVMAEIVGKNLMEDVILIRGGQDKGIQKGMPVITAGKVVVGRVLESFSTYSRVQLISAKENRIDARIAETKTAGVVRGQGGQKLLFDLIPQGEEFQVGNVVVTSNLGDVFPENLLIGEIAEILENRADPFQKANVKSFFDIQSADAVFVITSLR